MEIRKIYVQNQSTIPLGKQGENLVTQIVFPVPPDLVGTTCTLLHQRALDRSPYPVSVGFDGEGATWLVNSADTATPGRGTAQLVFTGEHGEILKSMQFPTLVLPSMEAGGEPPDPVKPWFDSLMDEIASVGGATPEDIQAAVEAYLTEHPIKEADPTVPDWAKSPEKPTYTAAEVGALPENELPDAINQALDQAKQSGVFDGKNGSPGIVISTSEPDDPSHPVWINPAGEPIPPAKDGTTPHIGENGNWYLGDTDTGNPSRGEPGTPGYTPIKGADYYTDEDKQEIVGDVLAALPTWTGRSY